MKTMRAKALASLLAGFVTLAGFSGCHASSAAMFSESATISASSAPQDSASSTTQISQTSEAGTYVQDDMTELMPQTYAYFTDLRLSADGAVEVVGLSQSGGIQLLRWTDDVWETAVESSQPAVANGALTVAADGTLWTVCRDDSGAYTLQSGTDPTAMQTIPVEALSQEEALPIGLRLAADGKIFLTAQVGETTVFVLVDPATRQATTVTQPGLLCRGFHLYVCGRKHQLVCARCHEWQSIATIQLAVGRAFGAGQRCRDPTKLPDLGRQQRYPSNCPGWYFTAKSGR